MAQLGRPSRSMRFSPGWRSPPPARCRPRRSCASSPACRLCRCSPPLLSCRRSGARGLEARAGRSPPGAAPRLHSRRRDGIVALCATAIAIDLAAPFPRGMNRLRPRRGFLSGDRRPGRNRLSPRAARPRLERGERGARRSGATGWSCRVSPPSRCSNWRSRSPCRRRRRRCGFSAAVGLNVLVINLVQLAVFPALQLRRHAGGAPRLLPPVAHRLGRTEARRAVLNALSSLGMAGGVLAYAP